MSMASRFTHATAAQKRVINTIEKWCDQVGRHLCGGTAVGKYYDTIILDLTYQGGEIAINSEGWNSPGWGLPGVTVNNVHIKNARDFETFKAAVFK